MFQEKEREIRTTYTEVSSYKYIIYQSLWNARKATIKIQYLSLNELFREEQNKKRPMASTKERMKKLMEIGETEN